MRRTLDILRTDGDAEVDTSPHAGLGALDSLAENVRAVGVTVRMTVRLDERRFPPDVELTSYRIVQEALSNVVRHAPGSTVDVAVRPRSEALLIDVVNGPSRGHDPIESEGKRRGLIGMRERVETRGGSLYAGATDDGGFEVRAVLPVPEDV